MTFFDYCTPNQTFANPIAWPRVKEKEPEAPLYKMIIYLIFISGCLQSFEALAAKKTNVSAGPPLFHCNSQKPEFVLQTLFNSVTINRLKPLGTGRPPRYLGRLPSC